MEYISWSLSNGSSLSWPNCPLSAIVVGAVMRIPTQSMGILRYALGFPWASPGRLASPAAIAIVCGAF
eukprot:1811139-Pyramimonas_sp.AAC.1